MIVRIFRYSFYLLLFTFVFDFCQIFFSIFDGVEYVRTSLYASDALLAIFIVSGVALIFSRWAIHDLFAVSRFKWILFTLALFFMFAILSLIGATSLWLGLYALLRLGALILMALLLAYALRRHIILFRDICIMIVSLAVAQSLIGFLQFRAQSDLGLQVFGESVLRPDTLGVAKILFADTTFIRAYGTFPHPNILGAFLIIGFLACAYLWERRSHESMHALRIYEYAYYTFAIFVILLGILLSFSRVAWAAVAITFIIFFYRVIKCLLSDDRQIGDIVISFVSIVLLSMVVQTIIFFPFVMHRFAISTSDGAISERITYAWIALDEIRERPLLGVGIGNHVLYAIEHGLYQRYGMFNIWQWQPAHNIYLLIFSEVGVFGFLFFLSFIFLAIARNMKGRTTSIFFVFLLMIFAMLFLGFFDHFLWTIEQGRLLFWIVLGMLIGVTGSWRPHSLTDKARASEA